MSEVLITYTAARQVRVAGTDITWTGIGQWLRRVRDVCGMIRPSAEHYRRCDRLLNSLEDEDVRRSFDIPALDGLERLFDRERRGGTLFHGPYRCWSRPEIARRLQLVRARQAALRLGRGVTGREKGPAFDVTRLPDHRLLALIQSHRDPDIVALLRLERKRREEIEENQADKGFTGR